MRSNQGNGDQHGQANRDELRQQTFRVAIKNPGAPASSKAKAEAHKNGTQANADQKQQALTHPGEIDHGQPRY